MRSSRSLRVFVLTVLLCTIGCIALRQALAPPPDLSCLAVRVPLRTAFAPPTRLISTGEAPFAVSPDGRLFRTDIPAKRDVPFGGPENFVSPDGRWVLIPMLNRAVAIDGSSRTAGNPGYAAENNMWLPDSRRWVGLDFARGGAGMAATVHDVDAPKMTCDVPLGSPVGAFGFPDYLFAHMLGAVSPDRVLVQTSALSEEIGGPAWARFLRVRLHLPDHRWRAHFFEFSVGGPGAPAVRQYAVTLPAGATGADTSFSRQGRLVWLLYHATGRWNTQLTAIDLAVSRPDGSQMRVMGRLAIDPASLEAQDESLWPGKLTWLPDDAHVRFVFRDTLWTIPVR